MDAAVVRGATWRPGTEVPPWPDLTGETAGPASWRAWLRQVWELRGFADAVEASSPVLARRVQEICGGRRAQERDVRRAVLAVIRYLLRASGRATPFGLFAGAAPARIAATPTARLGEDHRAVARIDAVWLAAVVTRLEAEPSLLPRLDVMANNLAFARDGRLVLGWQPSGVSTSGGPSEVSIRHTGPVGAVMDAARYPIRLADLADKLSHDFPGVPGPVIDAALAGLVAQRFLVTSLRPPMTSTDPLGHLLSALAAAGADAVPGLAALTGRLHGIGEDLSRHNRARSPAHGRQLRAGLARALEAACPADHPVTVDLRLDWDVAVPEAVAAEAAAAAAALARLARRPQLSPAWADWHGRLLERYGPGALVPVTDVLDADAGLGYPAGYLGSGLPVPSAPLPERDMKLLALAQKAAMQQETEIVLDEEMIADLAVADATRTRVQPHTELCVRVHASSVAALSRGEFELAVLGVSRAAGTTTGRFLDLFDAQDQARMFAAYAGSPAVSQDAITAQVSAPAPCPRTENVTRAPQALPDLIALGEHHRPGMGVIPLDDLAVSADVSRVYLVSLSRRRPVEPVLFSAVELTSHAHPLLRFLCEAPTAMNVPCDAFSWGTAAALPFLPALRYRRTVLFPARWLLDARDLPGPAASWQDWSSALTGWLRQCRVPDVVYLGEGDLRIRVDMNETAHLALLRDDLNRAGHAMLRQAPDPGALGWIGGRVHEIVIPLAATGRPAAARTWHGSVIRRDHGHLPAAGEWLYVKLFTHPGRQTAILTTHLPRLLDGWEPEPDWWFVRHHDPHDHLRVRLRIPAGDGFGPAATRVGAWTAGLRRAGLVGQVQWDTYYPETGRFGSGAAMSAAELFFAADSASAVAQLAATANRSGPDLLAVIAASMADLVTGLTGSTGQGMRWLIGHAATSIPAPARVIYDQAVALANPGGHGQALAAYPGGDLIAASWKRRRRSLTVYRDALAAAGEIAPAALLPDLLHLHHVRMAGIDLTSERACLHLARAAALSWTTRTKDAS